MRGSCTCSCRHCHHAPAIPHPFKCAAAAVQLYKQYSHPFIYHTPNTHFRRSDVPSHPLFITPPNTPCGCPYVVSHPVVYHPPFGAHASCTLSPGVHKIPHPPQDTTPGDNVFKAQNVITGVCYLVSFTVGRSSRNSSRGASSVRWAQAI